MFKISLEFTVDRIEDGYVVIVSRDKKSSIVNWPLNLIEFPITEGDILSFNIEKNTNDKTLAQRRVKNLLQKLQNKG